LLLRLSPCCSQRAAIAAETKNAILKQIAEKREREKAEKAKEEEQAAKLRGHAVAYEREVVAEREAENRRKQAYMFVLDKQRQCVSSRACCSCDCSCPRRHHSCVFVACARSRKVVEARETERQREMLAKQLDAAADDPTILAEVHVRCCPRVTAELCSIDAA
jgi:hypothetical protein